MTEHNEENAILGQEEEKKSRIQEKIELIEEARAESLKLEKVELIEEAIRMVEAAKELVDAAVDGTEHEANFQAYASFGLDTALGNANPHDSSLFTLRNWISGEEE